MSAHYYPLQSHCTIDFQYKIWVMSLVSDYAFAANDFMVIMSLGDSRCEERPSITPKQRTEEKDEGLWETHTADRLMIDMHFCCYCLNTNWFKLPSLQSSENKMAADFNQFFYVSVMHFSVAALCPEILICLTSRWGFQLFAACSGCSCRHFKVLLWQRCEPSVHVLF